MPISLVPDEETAPETISEDEARSYLANVKTAKLDALRVKIPTMKTSELIGLACNPDAVCFHLGVSDMTNQGQQAIFMAGALAIGDEIDRRIPTPK